MNKFLKEKTKEFFRVLGSLLLTLYIIFMFFSLILLPVWFSAPLAIFSLIVYSIYLNVTDWEPMSEHDY